jgi:hypothetical protein
MIDSYGLVHRGVAHTKIRTRGRPGHEKLIGPGLLVQTDADFADVNVYPPEYERLGQVSLAGVAMSSVRYDGNLWNELVKAGVRQPALVRYIRDYRPPRGKDESRLDCDLWYMQQVYFSHNRDEERRAQIVKRAVKARPEWSGFEDFILGEPAASDWTTLDRVGFDELPAAAQRDGTAFVNNPTTREGAGQGTPAGNVGPFINTFQDLDADVARGTLLLPEFEIVGDAITLQVGGGHDPNTIYVDLIVDGERRFWATGCNSDIMGRRLWPTSDLIGKRARLRLVDGSSGAWSHLVADEIVQWKRLGPKREAPEAHAIDPTFQR